MIRTFVLPHPPYGGVQTGAGADGLLLRPGRINSPVDSPGARVEIRPQPGRKIVRIDDREQYPTAHAEVPAHLGPEVVVYNGDIEDREFEAVLPKAPT